LNRPSWDPSKISPIFFGYNSVSAQQQLSIQGSTAGDLRDAEARALGRAKQSKLDAKGDLESKMTANAISREAKIQELKTKYDKSNDKRQQDMLRNKELMNPSAFRLYSVDWMREKKEADKAFEIELTRMVNAHETHSANDRADLKRLMAETVLFDDSVGMERPTAALIEDIAKIEITKWTTELYKRCSTLEVQQLISFVFPSTFMYCRWLEMSTRVSRTLSSGVEAVVAMPILAL
jgi:hypothetical protein